MAQNPFLTSPFDQLNENTSDKYALPGIKQEQPDTRQPTQAASNFLPPEDIRPVFEAAAKEFNVPVNVLMALGHQESRYNSNAIGQPTQWGRAKGLMQYLDSTAKGMGINPFDPTEAIPAAAKQIRERLDKGYSMEDAVKEHFAGPDRKLWGEKTNAYGREVMEKVGKIGDMLGMPSPSAGQARNVVDDLNAQEPGRYRAPTAEELDAFEKSQQPAAAKPTQAEIDNQGFFDRAGQAVSTGYDNMVQSLNTAKFAVAGGDSAELAKSLASKFAREQERQKTTGEQEIDKAFQEVTDAKGVWETTKAGVKAIGTAIANPKDLAVGIAEQAPNMLPTLGAGAGGAGAGAAVGAGVGSAFGGIGAVPGAIGGAIWGSRAGMVAGTTATELGAEVEQMVLERLQSSKQAPTEQNIKTLLDDTQFQTEARNRGLAKGLTVGIIDQIFMGLGGKVAGKAATAPTKMGKAGYAAGAVGLDAVGETTGEATSQLVARGEVDAGDALREGVYGLGQSVVEPAAGAAMQAGKRAANSMRPQAPTPAQDAQAVAAQNNIPNIVITGTEDGQQVTTVTPAQPSKAAGPLSRAIENAADQPARVTVNAPEGQITGFVQSETQDRQGNTVTRVLGDDGQVYTFTSADNVEIKPEAGPLTSAVEQAAAQTPAQTPFLAPEAAAQTAEIPPVEQNQAVTEEKPKARNRVMEQNQQVTDATLANDGTKPAEPAPAAELAKLQQQPAKAPQPKLEDMTEPELRARLKYIAGQAKANGGWNKMLTQERRKVEAQINKFAEQIKQETTNDQRNAADLPVRDVGAASAAVAAAQQADQQGTGAGGTQAIGAGATAAGTTVPGAGANVSGADSTADRQPALADKPFDSAAWNKERDDRIKASKEAGNTHLDQVPAYVETMRGKEIYSVHDPKERGTIRTVDNRGNLYVNWSDDYSAEKNLASPSFEGKKQVFQTSLGPTDLKDYVLGQGEKQQDKPAKPKKASKEDLDHLFGTDKKREASLARIAKGTAFFGTDAKAKDFITKNGLKDTHTVEQTGKVRFEVKPKSEPTIEAATVAAEATKQPSEFGSRWDAMSPEEREALAKSAGWVTSKNNLNPTGKQIVKRASADIPEGTLATLEGFATQQEKTGGNQGAMDGSWRKEFERAKEAKDFAALDKLYRKVRVALNGVAQGYGDETVKQFEEFKAEIEKYADSLKNKEDQITTQDAAAGNASTTVNQTDLQMVYQEATSYPRANNFALVANRKYGLSNENAVFIWNKAKNGEAISLDDLPDQSKRIKETKAQKEQQNGDQAAQTVETQTQEPQAPDTGAGEAVTKREFVEIKDLYGQSFRVTQSDLDGPRTRIPYFTKNGDRKGFVHRDNLDPTGQKKAALDAENADNPAFDVVTADQSKTFKTEAAAKAYATKNGYADTHQAVPAADVQAGLSGYLLKRIEQPTPKQAEAADTQPPAEAKQDEPKQAPPAEKPKAETKPKAKRAPKADNRKAELEAFYTPGNIIFLDYWQQHDRVLEFKWNDGNWSVKVEKVEKKGDKWVSVDSPRIHATTPGKDKVVERAPAAAKTDEQDKIEDFGEKIGGARKDVWAGFKDDLNAVKDEDIATEPFSKIWPAPDYQKLIDGGMSAEAVATIRALRDEVPAKPRASWKVSRWAEQVKTLREFANDVLNGKFTLQQMKDMAGANSVLGKVFGRIDLYQAVGHEKSLQGVNLSFHHYTLYKGQENVSLWAVEQDAKATAWSNWPRELATGKTKEEAVAAFKKKYATLDINKPASKEVSFEIYSRRGQNGYWIGKKVGRNPIFLEGPFATIKEARTFKDANNAKLVEKLEKAKEIPNERRETNEPRIGVDMRNGQDVTPQMFGETFGFRGVEFGNWVEQGKRQQDLNEAFDALMDMAAILNLPPKALSLNGELGLAFGARGKGGKNPAKAHYELDFVVINMTKKDGAGSLGHEWWHALDNYFSRMRGKGADMMTEALDVSLASRGSEFQMNSDKVRKQIIVAYGDVVRAIKQTALKARSAKLDSKRSKEYWTTQPEMSARAFESYLISKLQDQNASNDYLANIVAPDTWKAAEALGFELDDSYPYPTAGEIPGIRAAFDRFFQTVETKETEKGTALYSVAGDGNLTAPTSITEDETTGGLYAEFPGDAYAVFGQDSRGTIRVQSIKASNETRGRDILQWMRSEYGRPIKADEVAYSAYGFWERMEDEGLVDGWSEKTFTGNLKPAKSRGRYSVAADGTVTAEFGPVTEAYRNDPAGAIKYLMQQKTGEAIVNHPTLGEVSLVYGDGTYGLSHIAKRHGQKIISRIPELMADGSLYGKPDQPTGRLFLGTEADEATIRMDWNGDAKAWLVTAYEKHPDLTTAPAPKASTRSDTIKERTPGLAAESLRMSVEKGALSPVISALIDNGTIVLHATTKTLPDANARKKRGVQAITTADGKVHLVAANLTDANAQPVLFHEMFHKGGERLIGSTAWGDLMGRGASLYRQSEKSTGKAREFFDKARARVAAAKRQGAVATSMEVEEFLAYAIEEYETAPASIRKWVDDVIGLVKAWFQKTFGKQLGKVTPAQLTAMAKMALMDVAADRRGEMFGDLGTVFSATEQTNTPAFKRWSNGNQLIEIGESHEFKDGEGVVVQLVHGTTGDFSEFDQSKANVESDLGGGFYFTNNVDDVGENYAGLGPDLTNKIERIAEQIASETDRKYNDPEVVAEARQRFMANQGVTMPVFVRFDNPVVIGGSQPTWLDFNDGYDPDTDEYGEETGKVVELIEALREIESEGEFDSFDAQNAIDAIFAEHFDGENITAEDLINNLKGAEGIMYATDADGNMAGNEIIRQAFERIGYDGFIDQTVNDKFGSGKRVGKAMAGMDEETVHFIAFNPTQIKSSIGNNGDFDPTNNDIRYSVSPERAEAIIDEADAALDEKPADDFIGSVVGDISLGAKLIVHPRTVAAVHKEFTPVYRTAISQMETRDKHIAELGRDVQAYHVLDQAGKENVNKVLELGRLTSQAYTAEELRNGVGNVGEKSVVVMVDGKPQMTKAPVEALLTEVGEVVKLSDDEITAYLGLRKMFDNALDMLRDQTLTELGFEQFVGVKNAAKEIVATITDTTTDEQAERLRNIAAFVGEIEQAKRAGYVPFARYGDYVVTVKEKVADVEFLDDTDGNLIATGLPDSFAPDLMEMGAEKTVEGWKIKASQRRDVERLTEKTVYSTKIETGLTDLIGEKRAKKVDDIPAVKEAIEKAKAEWIGDNPNRRIVAFKAREKKSDQPVKLSDVDALAEVAAIDNATWDAVRDKLADAIKAKGFRRHFFHSDNVPGYTGDFERSVADYVIGMSGYLSRRQHMKRWDNAVTAITNKPQLFNYASKYRNYVNDPQEELAMVRQIGFFSYISGVTASAFANLTQVPLMTVPTLSQVAPLPLVMKELTRAYKDAAMMLSSGVGLDMFDPEKAPDDVRGILKEAWEEGSFVPLETFDLMMTARQRNVGARKGVKAFNNATQIVSLTFTFAERMNRLVTFIAAARLANKRAVQENARKSLSGDALARSEVLANWSPKSFAEWAVDESQYRMGKANRPTMMRGVGASIMQFKGFMLQTFEAWYRMTQLHGRSGKFAAAASLVALYSLAGLWGLPGADDLRKLIENIYKQITDKDLDLKTELRSWIARTSGSNTLAQIVSKGASYPLGIDLTRVGMGTVAPDSPLAAAGIPFDMLIGRPKRAFEKGSTGDYLGAMAELTPNFMKHWLVSGSWALEGVRDKRGNLILRPEDLSSGDLVMKALGFQPSIVTDIRDYEYAQRRQETAVDALKRSYTNKLAKAFYQLETTGDMEKAKEIEQRISDIYADIDEHNATASPEQIIKITNRTLRDKIMREREGVMGTWGKERKAARGAAEELRGVFGLSNQEDD